MHNWKKDYKQNQTWFLIGTWLEQLFSHRKRSYNKESRDMFFFLLYYKDNTLKIIK